ncbi:hypothetical protein [Methylomonas rapida]|jgi:hypothetical protein|uniref:VOC domain-containing protein n=1 Tax=Methylomonas rapida TaxID=2963939 RepID=A0ABY7GQH5_9GAMM|nr:hypothetical protein [Methylomonas rapida]WAR46764.1 hypothetical protein NM686_009695 [Methylomonas rapida]
MIHHISIAAHNPRQVAGVLAELLDGEVFPFSPAPGGFVAVCDDGHATLVEVYPIDTVMIPGTDDQGARFTKSTSPQGFVPNHAAISVAIDETMIKAIAAREGWRAVTCDRGGLFRVVEFWIENRILFELLTPDMARHYLAAMTLQNRERFTDQAQTPK